MANYRNEIDSSADTFKALSDQGRLRIVCALMSHDELCVCRIIAMLTLAPSTISKHLSILKSAGLINSRKKGKWVHYSLNETAQNTQLTDHLRASLKDDQQVANDAKLLEDIVEKDPEELCAMQRR
jgi:ArsR family transcriptional regulator